MILNDLEIIKRCGDGMIRPFSPEQVSRGTDASGRFKNGGKVISYGVSSYGYDICLGYSFKVFTNTYNAIVDPKSFDEKAFVEMSVEDFIVIPPNSFALGHSYEYVSIPRDLMVICLGKSTYARCGLPVHVTPLEPEWEGHITIEISNNTPLPAKIYAGEGICQLIFFKAHDICARSYKDKEGKYQGQKGVTLPKV